MPLPTNLLECLHSRFHVIIFPSPRGAPPSSFVRAACPKSAASATRRRRGPLRRERRSKGLRALGEPQREEEQREGRKEEEEEEGQATGGGSRARAHGLGS